MDGCSGRHQTAVQAARRAPGTARERYQALLADADNVSRAEYSRFGGTVGRSVFRPGAPSNTPLMQRVQHGVLSRKRTYKPIDCWRLPIARLSSLCLGGTVMHIFLLSELSVLPAVWPFQREGADLRRRRVRDKDSFCVYVQGGAQCAWSSARASAAPTRRPSVACAARPSRCAPDAVQWAGRASTSSRQPAPLPRADSPFPSPALSYRGRGRGLSRAARRSTCPDVRTLQPSAPGCGPSAALHPFLLTILRLSHRRAFFLAQVLRQLTAQQGLKQQMRSPVRLAL